MRKSAMLACLFALAISAQDLVHNEPNPQNSAHAQRQHYVVMVSLDGFRYDYPTLHGAPNMLALGKAGVSTPNGMVPSYPSLTFPNHYTLVTGLRPEHHGIVDNYFYDAASQRKFSMTKDSADGTFFDGMPLWSLAESQGMRSASFFWVGSQSKIAGYRPTFWTKFDDKFDDHKRIDQIVGWLQLPAADRPHLIFLYFSQADHAGHDHGPDSPEAHTAVQYLDGLIGELHARLDSLHLPIDLIVTADHGMVHPQGDWITLEDNPALAAAMRDVRRSGTLFYPDTEEQADKLYQAFKANPDTHYSVYRRKDFPKDLYYNESPREGDPIIIANGPYEIRTNAVDVKRKVLQGTHGFNPAIVPQMKAIFFAAGPDLKRGVELKSFPNVDVYDFVCKLLDLKPAPNDGSLTTLKRALKHK